MNAGFELDKLIAEIMGWSELSIVVTTGLPTQLQGVAPGTIASPYTGYKPKFVVPEYSTDIKAAWEVLEKMRGYGVISLIRKDSELHNEWEVIFNNDDSYGKSEATDAPLAICLAALNAIGESK